MLLDIILAPILFIFNWFIGLFPAIKLDNSILTGLYDFFNFISSVNRYFPISELFFCITILFIAYNFNFILYVINWLLNKILELIPFVG